MSDQSDSQNKSVEQIHMSEGTSPSSSSDEGSRSTPSNLPEAATRTRRKRTSDSEDEDYVAAEDEATSKKVVLKKEYGSTHSTKPGLNKKVPAKRTPMAKVRRSTQVPEQSKLKEAPAKKVITSKSKKVPTGETMKFTIESEDEDYVAAEDEATSKKVVLKKEYGSAHSTKPGLKKKVPAKRTPMPKVRRSTQVPEQTEPKEALAKKVTSFEPKKIPKIGRAHV